jgi:hypothetical protein
MRRLMPAEVSAYTSPLGSRAPVWDLAAWVITPAVRRWWQFAFVLNVVRVDSRFVRDDFLQLPENAREVVAVSAGLGRHHQQGK